jgi:hypothetical protein
VDQHSVKPSNSCPWSQGRKQGNHGALSQLCLQYDGAEAGGWQWAGRDANGDPFAVCVIPFPGCPSPPSELPVPLSRGCLYQSIWVPKGQALH